DCDPLQKKVVTNSDQLLPLLAMQTSKGVKGLAGLFVAGLTSASLSYVSSALSGLAAVLTYEYIRKALPKLSDERLAQLSKVVTVASGILGFGLVFVVEKMGNILPVTASLIGAIAGPSLGIFTLGMLFPWANAMGALTGIVTVTVLMMSYAIGNFVANNENLLPDQRLSLSWELEKRRVLATGSAVIHFIPLASNDWSSFDSCAWPALQFYFLTI
ncbi:unnamed protein product, partial [Allacma fusca]